MSPQLVLPGWKFSSKLAFGGSALNSHPKTARPVATKSAMHLVLRSTQATGAKSFLKQARTVKSLVETQAAQLGIRVYDFANAGNHLHIVIRVPSRRGYQKFVRAVTGLLARTTLGKERGAARAAQVSARPTTEVLQRQRAHTEPVARAPFWDARPFSRIVSWGRDYARLKDYLRLNRIEAVGFGRLDARRLVARGNLIEGNTS